MILPKDLDTRLAADTCLSVGGSSAIGSKQGGFSKILLILLLLIVIIIIIYYYFSTCLSLRHPDASIG